MCSPMAEKLLGENKYFITFKDDYSEYRAVYLINLKTKLTDVLSRLLAEVKTAGYTVKELLIDGGREFNNSQIHKTVQKAGLNH